MWKSLEWFDRRRLFWIALVVAALVYSQFEFWKQPSRGDRANWDYFAQVIARGGVPYRDVVNIKSPLSAYIGAAAIVITRPFGLRDVIAIRITFILLAALTVAFTFLIALDYFNSRRVALLSATIMLTFDAFARFNSGGIQPKTAMVLFGLVTLWAIKRNRAFVAGAFGMLSALSWQPGLLFIGAAGLGFSRYLTSWRDMKVAKLIAGAAVPLAILLTYFWAAGALKDFYQWNIDFNATVYAPHEMRSLTGFFHRLDELLGNFYRHSRVYFYLAGVGLIIAVVREIKRLGQQGRGYVVGSAMHAVMIAPVVYFAFCMLDIQSGPDLIPLVPFVAMFATIVLVYAIEQAATLLARVRGVATRPAVQNWMNVALAALIFYRSLSVSVAFEREFPTLEDQDVAVAEIVSHLEPGEKIFVYGATEILVLSGLTNASKHFLLDKGKDEYLDQIEPGGFNGWLERLKAERPKIVAFERLHTNEYLQKLEKWVAADYYVLRNEVFFYYIRKDSAG